MPTPDAIDRTGLDLTDADMADLLKVDPAEWVEAVAGQEELIRMFGERMPKALRDEHAEVARRVSDAMTPADLQGRDVGH